MMTALAAAEIRMMNVLSFRGGSSPVDEELPVLELGRQL